MRTQVRVTSASPEQRRETLDQRLEKLFWALLFTVAGSIWLFPEDRLPEGTWLIGIGLVLLVPNLLRYLNQIPVHVLSLVLGSFALAAGVLELVGLQLPFISLALILIGAGILLNLLRGTGQS